MSRQLMYTRFLHMMGKLASILQECIIVRGGERNKVTGVAYYAAKRKARNVRRKSIADRIRG